MLTVTPHTVADTLVLHCHGRLVRGEELALLCAAVHHHGRDVVLDLSEVSAIDAAGTGNCAGARRLGARVRAGNGSTRAKGPAAAR